MGFFNSLYGRTGPGKLAAAKNALVAKYMYHAFTDEERTIINDKIAELLVAGGIPLSTLKEFLARIEQPEFYSVAALAFAALGIQPAMKELFPRGRWNLIDNPLVAMVGAESEIVMAKNEILRRYGIQIDFIEFGFSQADQQDTYTQPNSQQPESSYVVKSSKPKQTFHTKWVVLGVVVIITLIYLTTLSQNKIVATRPKSAPAVEASAPVQAQMSAASPLYVSKYPDNQVTQIEKVAQEMILLYPFLDHTKPYANEQAITEVKALRDDFISQGIPAPEALKTAVFEVAPKYSTRTYTSRTQPQALAPSVEKKPRYHQKNESRHVREITSNPDSSYNNAPFQEPYRPIPPDEPATKKTTSRQPDIELACFEEKVKGKFYFDECVKKYAAQ